MIVYLFVSVHLVGADESKAIDQCTTVNSICQHLNQISETL